MSQAFELKLGVPHSKSFIDDEDIRFQSRSSGEGKPGLHPGGKSFKGSVDKFCQFAKFDDPVRLGLDLLAAHPQAQPSHADILPAGVLLIKTGAQLEDGRQTAMYLHISLGFIQSACQYFEEGALPRAIAAQNTNTVPPADFEGNITQAQYSECIGFLVINSITKSTGRA